MRAILLLAALFSAPAQAMWITVEPDDFLDGNPITSPFANFSHLADSERLPVYATTDIHRGFSAPTGSAVMEPLFVAVEQPDGSFSDGLLVEFLAPVQNVIFNAVNVAYDPGLYIDLYLFLAGTGGSCNRTESGLWTIGVPVSVSVSCDQSISHMIMGGGDTIAAIAFDQFVFEVPEPGTLLLFSLGLLGLAAGRGSYSRTGS